MVIVTFILESQDIIPNFNAAFWFARHSVWYLSAIVSGMGILFISKIFTAGSERGEPTSYSNVQYTKQRVQHQPEERVSEFDCVSSSTLNP